MLSIPFLTELDSRAAIKGSRDPLGVQPIGTRLGRHVVGNLTTVSNSVRDFTVTLLGYYFAERVAQETGFGDDLNVCPRWGPSGCRGWDTTARSACLRSRFSATISPCSCEGSSLRHTQAAPIAGTR